MRSPAHICAQFLSQSTPTVKLCKSIEYSARRRAYKMYYYSIKRSESCVYQRFAPAFIFFPSNYFADVTQHMIDGLNQYLLCVLFISRRSPLLLCAQMRSAIHICAASQRRRVCLCACEWRTRIKYSAQRWQRRQPMKQNIRIQQMK